MGGKEDPFLYYAHPFNEYSKKKNTFLT